MTRYNVEEIFTRIMNVAGISTFAQLANILEVSPQSLSNSRNRCKIPHGWIEKIAKEYNVSEQTLYYGSDEIQGDNTQENDEIILVDIKEARLSAGLGSDYTSGESIGKRAFMGSWIKHKGDPKNMVLMEVSGDSMYPEIYDKDLVLIDHSKTEIYPSKIYAVGFEDTIYIKRIEVQPSKIILKSANKEYDPIVLNLNEYTSEQFRIIGKVLWVGREY